MNVIRVRNVHEALPLALQVMSHAGIRTDSRNGACFQAPGPVSTVYSHPMERVLFWEERNANPFFHYFESLWMLGGRNDVESVARFAGNMNNYSDDGKTFHGAYGYRWRVGMPSAVAAGWRSRDQLAHIGQALRDNPRDRRQVLQMWDAESDLGNPCKDVPCNDTATFQVSPDTGCLDLVVFNRSNDIVWGCYGANAVQFSTLLEYVSARAGLRPGTYTQISVNWHGYDATYTPLLHRMQERAMRDVPPEVRDGDLGALINEPSPYELTQCRPYALMHPGEDPDMWDRDLHRILANAGRCPTNRVFSCGHFAEVTIPILEAHDTYKDRNDEARFESALKSIEKCRASDWRLACTDWLLRRWKNWRASADSR